MLHRVSEGEAELALVVTPHCVVRCVAGPRPLEQVFWNTAALETAAEGVTFEERLVGATQTVSVCLAGLVLRTPLAFLCAAYATDGTVKQTGFVAVDEVVLYPNPTVPEVVVTPNQDSPELQVSLSASHSALCVAYLVGLLADPRLGSLLADVDKQAQELFQLQQSYFDPDLDSRLKGFVVKTFAVLSSEHSPEVLSRKTVFRHLPPGHYVALCVASSAGDVFFDRPVAGAFLAASPPQEFSVSRIFRETSESKKETIFVASALFGKETLYALKRTLLLAEQLFSNNGTEEAFLFHLRNLLLANEREEFLFWLGKGVLKLFVFYNKATTDPVLFADFYKNSEYFRTARALFISDKLFAKTKFLFAKELRFRLLLLLSTVAKKENASVVLKALVFDFLVPLLEQNNQLFEAAKLNRVCVKYLGETSEEEKGQAQVFNETFRNRLDFL